MLFCLENDKITHEHTSKENKEHQPDVELKSRDNETHDDWSIMIKGRLLLLQ